MFWRSGEEFGVLEVAGACRGSGLRVAKLNGERSSTSSPASLAGSPAERFGSMRVGEECESGTAIVKLCRS